MENISFWDILLGIGAMAISLWFFFDKRSSKKVTDTFQADDRLIKTLQDTVTVLEEKVLKLETNEKEMQKEIEGLKKENSTLALILQGRDEKTQRFYDQAFKALDDYKKHGELIEATHALVMRMAEMYVDGTKKTRKTNAKRRK